MPRVIETKFDNPIEEDIILEDSDQSASMEQMLQNAENILKSFKYLKELIESSNPSINSLTKVSTIDSGDNGKTVYNIQEKTNLLSFKNIDDKNNHSIFINDGEYIVFPFETVELPVNINMKIEYDGKFSTIETIYN